jgi:hypothetical protein
MRRNISRLIFIGIAIAGIGLFIGCQGDQGPAGPQGPIGSIGPQGQPGEAVPFITGTISAPRHTVNWDEVYGTADFYVVKAPSLPSVTVNSIPVDLNLQFPDGKLTYHSGDLPVTGGNSATVRVSYKKTDQTDALAQGSVTVPADFAITGDSVKVGPADTVHLDWMPANGADGYFISLRVFVAYVDTSDSNHGLTFEMDTVVTDTTFEQPADVFFPDTSGLAGYISYEAQLDLSAVSGPLYAGDAGNITGDGYGFIYGWNDGPDISLDLDIPLASKSSAHILGDPQEFFLKYTNRLMTAGDMSLLR